MNRPKDSATFEKELFEFLKSQGQTNLKIPMIGQKALNLYTLYNEVISRGGAENVSNNKLWKDIVNKFDLPATCTSASFTLKNHYQKYLLAYEQKFFFNKSESEMIKKLENTRQKRVKTDSGPEILMKTGIGIDGPGLGGHERHGPTMSLEQLLKESYQDRNPNEQVYFIKRKRLVPFSTEVKRIILAFESKIATEVRFALNALSTYSCSKQTPFYLENYRVIFNEFLNFFEYIIRRVEGSHYLSKDPFSLDYQPSANGADNPFDVAEADLAKSRSDLKEIPERGAFGEAPLGERSQPVTLVHFDHTLESKKDPPPRPEAEVSSAKVDSQSQRPDTKRLPLLRPTSDQRLSETIVYVDQLPLSEHLEQLKIILSIFRNLINIKINETFMNKDVKLIKLFYHCFLNNNDPEVNRVCLEIFSVLSRYIILSDKPMQYEKHYFDKIVAYINSDSDFELGVENLHNLMINQENENIIEANLGRFLGALVKFLTSNLMDVVERVLEIVCHFSDLKIATRILFAKQPHFFQRLVAIIAGNSSKCQNKLIRVAAMIINNILITPMARPYFKPFERDLFAIASVDERM